MPARRHPSNVRRLMGLPERPAPNAGGVGTPSPPAWLPREAKAEWRRVVEACASYPTWIQRVDRAVLATFCMSWAVYAEAAKDVAVRGALVPARSSADHARAGGALVKNPAVQVMRDAAATLKGLAAQLGFTPESRQRLTRGDFEPEAPNDLLGAIS